MPKSVKSRRFPLVIAMTVFALGLTLLFWRPVSNAVSQWQMDTAVASFRNGSGTTAEADAASAANTKEHVKFEAYNDKVRRGEAGAVNDPFSTAAQDDLGIDGDGVIATIDIPAMGCTLPVRFGATEENMARGAAVVAGTSLPLGEVDSNCVIAAHRGWNSAAMFRDIENLSIGDDVYVANSWETLHYRVVEVRVVDPNDTAACAVQDGRDLVTLLTCHPYGVHPSPSRMLVYCERVGEDAAGGGSASTEDARGEETSPAVAESAGNERSPLLSAETDLFGVGCAILVAFFLWLIFRRIRKIPPRSRR